MNGLTNGLTLAKKVGLTAKECSTNFEKISCECSLAGVEKILQEKFQGNRAVFVAWQIQNIVWGTYDGAKLLLRDKNSPAPENWLECRIFNNVEELHLKRGAEKFVGRYVEDTEGTGNFYADSFARFWGEKFDAADGYINLLDSSRKLYMEIPCDKDGAKWYGLLTRNYIDSDSDTGLSGYIDYRFVAIEPAGGVN